ncbi:MAG: ACT domain-containing protein [Ruminococcus sp.]|nr:ACT domain-containing protein [Ruminococcus sp.]
MLIKQLSIFLENKPGRLTAVTRSLSEAGIDIRALSIADTKDFGIVRLIVSNPDKAKEALAEANCMIRVNHVIAIAVEDRPGGLANVLEMLVENKIGVEYMYSYVSRTADTAYVILRADDNKRAEALLSEQGVKLLSPEDVYEEA